MITDTLENHKRLVEESRNKKFLVEELKKEFSSLGPETGTKHYKLKLQYHELKNTLREEQFKLFLLEGYDTNQHGDGGPVLVSEKDLRETTETLREFKGRLEKSRNRIDDIAEEMDLTLKEFHDDTTTMERLIQDLEQKKLRLTETYGSALETTKNNEREARLTSLQAELHTTVAAISAQVEQLRSQVEHSRAAVAEYRAKVQDTRGEWRLVNWCEHACRLFQTHHGLIDQGVTAKGWTLDICGPQGLDTEIRLTVHIALAWNGLNRQPNIRHVKVDNSDFPVSHIVERTVATNSLPYLLAHLQDAWLREYPLLAEIHSLRKRFAIDWDYTDRCLSVICASSVVCTLAVDGEYSGHGGVALRKVTGDNQGQALTLDNPNASLTDWVEHLHRKLSTPAGEMMDH